MKREKLLIALFLAVMAVTLGVMIYRYADQGEQERRENKEQSDTQVQESEEESDAIQELPPLPDINGDTYHNIFGEECTEPSRDYEYVAGTVDYYKPDKFMPEIYGEGDEYVYQPPEIQLIQDENDENNASYSDTDRSKAIIIDTDFASDADDPMAIRLALCFQDMDMLEVRGIALSTTYSRSPLAVHALCKYDGYGNIPVAMDTSGNGVQVHTNYVDVMYEWPKNRDDYEQPVKMYRRLLAESEGKVNIITLGFLQNIQNLMKSGADQYSPLTGAELIREKVDTLYVVGGSDNGRPSFNFYWTGEKVINAAKAVTKGFPARVVYLSSDLSYDTFCGQFYQNEDRKGRDIMTKTLAANSQAGGVVAWDVFSMWCAVQEIHGNLENCHLSLEEGNWYVSDTGATEWTQDGLPEHYRLVKGMEGANYNEYLNGVLYKKFKTTLGE